MKDANHQNQWFKFYHTRWLLSDTYDNLNFAEQGIYVGLLCLQNANGGFIPNDPDLLSKKLRKDSEAVVRFWNKFGPAGVAVRLWCTSGEDTAKAFTANGHKFNPPKQTTLELPLEKIREEDKREENINAALSRVWDYYISKLGKHPKLLTFTAMRKQKGRARFDDCLLKTGGDIAKAEKLMMCAIDALSKSSFHLGDNPQNRRYDSWEKNLYNSTERLESWLERS